MTTTLKNPPKTPRSKSSNRMICDKCQANSAQPLPSGWAMLTVADIPVYVDLSLDGQTARCTATFFHHFWAISVISHAFLKALCQSCHCNAPCDMLS